jgi:hypothetical protein
MTRPGTRSALGTALLLLAILVLGLLVAAQQRREARLRAALVQFKRSAEEKINARFDLPYLWAGGVAIPLNWGGSNSLDTVIQYLTSLTARIPVLSLRIRLNVKVDTVGLLEAGQTLQSRVQLPPAPKRETTVRELFQQILEPNDLAWHVENETLTLTSRKALDRFHQSILKRLERPVILKWSKGDSLATVIERVRVSTEAPNFPSGLPILMQLDGSESSYEPLSAPDSVHWELPIGEQLRRFLEPLGLRYELREGAVMIVPQEAADESI